MAKHIATADVELPPAFALGPPQRAQNRTDLSTPSSVPAPVHGTTVPPRFSPGRSCAIPRAAPSIRPTEMIQPRPKQRPQHLADMGPSSVKIAIKWVETVLVGCRRFLRRARAAHGETTSDPSSSSRMCWSNDVVSDHESSFAWSVDHAGTRRRRQRLWAPPAKPESLHVALVDLTLQRRMTGAQLHQLQTKRSAAALRSSRPLLRDTYEFPCPRLKQFLGSGTAVLTPLPRGM